MTETPAPGLSWRPGRVTFAILALALMVGAWLVSPPWWDRLGNDSQVFYSAATLAADGGNPYDFQVLRAEEQRVRAQVPPAARGAFSPSPYAYPPLMTSLWQLLLPLGERGFYWANVGLLGGAGVLGAILGLAAFGVRTRLVPVVALVVSAPFVLGLVAGNPSNLLLLVFGFACYAYSRGQPVVAGAVLAAGLVKAPVGVAVAAALMLASPGLATALVGFLAGAALFVALNLLALGPGPMRSWLGSLLPYGSTLGSASGTGYEQCCLAGLPGLLASQLPIALATVAALVAVAAAIGLFARIPQWRRAAGRDRFARVAVLTAAALAVSPYLHLNDLVLEAVPLAFVATHRLTPVARVLLTTWGLGALPPLAVTVALGLLLHAQPVSTIGFGVLVSALSLVAVLAGVEWRRPQPAWGPSPPDASQRR